MKQSKTLLLGILSGLLCAAAVFLFMQSVQGEAVAARAEALSRYGGEQIEVCVATRDIAPGENIDASNVATKLWLVDLLPEEAIGSFSDISGKQVASSIYAGEVVSLRRFETERKDFEPPEGLSVLSVPAQDVQSIGGNLKAGMSIDVYATGTSTDLVAHNVLVLATNVEAVNEEAENSLSWVTLALPPESVQEVITASQTMELYFVLPGNTTEGGS